MLSRFSAALSDNVRASLFMLVSMAGFVVNDTFVKLAAADLSSPQIMAVRGVMATALLLVLAGWRGALGKPRDLIRPLVLLRAAMDVGATLAYITALASLPLANAAAIFQALPLIATVGAAVFLKEQVGWRRWTAIGAGFIGVLIIVRPGVEGFTVHSLAVLASVVFAAIRDLATRRMPAGIPSLSISMITSLAVMIAGWALVPFTGWTPLEAKHIALLTSAAVTIAIGYVFIVEAMRVGDLGFVAPFRYSVLIYALVISLAVFGEMPDVYVLAGSAIIVASGVYTLYRERLRGKSDAARTQVL